MNSCPRDRQLFASNDVNGYRYYTCEQCHGFWLPGASLHRMLSATGLTELQARPHAGKGDIACPDCRTGCDAIIIEGCRLDYCPQCHGVWLDAGEVRRVRRLFPEASAVVIADEERPSEEMQQALAAGMVVDAVGNLLILLLG